MLADPTIPCCPPVALFFEPVGKNGAGAEVPVKKLGHVGKRPAFRAKLHRKFVERILERGFVGHASTRRASRRRPDGFSGHVGLTPRRSPERPSGKTWPSFSLLRYPNCNALWPRGQKQVGVPAPKWYLGSSCRSEIRETPHGDLQISPDQRGVPGQGFLRAAEAPTDERSGTPPTR